MADETINYARTTTNVARATVTDVKNTRPSRFAALSYYVGSGTDGYLFGFAVGATNIVTI